ncbi:tubby-related protein 4 isoform X2 [Fopius arisanus]|nr:PREDICTED: tubby-related protein 4 isoform X2 [Fopius arisanus]
MHLHFEKNTNAKCDCNILSLSWMGKVPDEVPEDEGWTLSRTNYYQEGWLATGNARGLVGVTFTTSHCRTRNAELPLRANYNLRGHQSEVILVNWNEPYQKLASCDSSGVIFVWIKYEGRWSIELINDRSTPVTHFSWSHDGRMALICYRDGFVLVGSVAGQRYWSSMLNDQATITCGIWTPDDQQVYFGTTAGQLIVMDVHGAMVSEVQLSGGITSMAWSAEKFKMEEGDDDLSGNIIQHDERRYVLAVCLIDGNIIMLRSYDDVSPITIKTGLKSPLHAEWSNSRKLLAIAGTSDLDAATRNPQEYTNVLKFYSDSGSLVYTTAIPYTQCQVSALTWGHNDRRLFVATGTRVHAAWVSRRVGSLQLLSRLAVRAALSREPSVDQLPLPPRLRALVAALFANTIRSCVPEPRELRKFVSRPPVTGGRLHCTMLRHAGEPAPCYTLYLEYLGGLVPLLKGRRTSKIRPEFVIFDPQSHDSIHMPDYNYQSPSLSDGSDTERDTTDSYGSPRNKRKYRRRRDDRTNDETDDLTYIDTLPEHARLVEVTSNIWGTKFKIHGLTDSVPANLGQVTYRTSLLHLQPRQMTLVMTELRDDLPPGPDPSFNPNLFSEDEEETFQESQSVTRKSSEASPPPIAPMTPRNSRLSINRPKSQVSSQFITPDALMSPVLAQADSYDDFSYIDVQDVMDMGDNVRATSSNHRASRHHPPRCCDVPALQSPKNSVAPTQTLIATSNSNTDYSSNIQRVKTALTDQQVMRKELENNKINQADEKITLAVTQANIISTSMQSGQNSALRQSSIITGHSSPSQVYWNSSSVSGPMLPSCNQLNYVNVKINHKPHSNSSSSNSQSSSAINFSKNVIGSPNSNTPTCSRQSVNVNYPSTCSQCSPNKRKEKTTGCCGKSSCSATNSVTSGRSDELRFIDEESREIDFVQTSGVRRTPTVVSIGPMCPPLDPIIRSCSVGYLDMVDTQMIPCDVALKMLRKEAPNKRLVLVSRKTRRRRKNKGHEISQQCTKLKLKTCGKSKSLDSSDMFPSTEIISLPPQLTQHAEETAGQMTEVLEISHDESYPVAHCCPDPPDAEKNREDNSDRRKKDNYSLGEAKSSGSLSSSLDGLAARLRDFDDTHSLPPLSPRLTTRLPRSSPSSPAPSKKGKRPASASPIRRRLLSSPLLNRRSRKSRGESSDDEGQCQDQASRSYRNLETFQKAQLRQKLKQKVIGASGHKAEELVMHNKAPMWNEASQVYQLDFGGRVTQESAKNFQIEYRGKQVMQFGRIDGNAYTLDFQYPFSALQAFSVALANVTQRLK